MSEVELHEQERQLMTPTGEVIDLSNPSEVALAYDSLQQLKRMTKEIEGKLKEALLDYSKNVVLKKTFELEGVGKVEIKGGSEKHYDAQGLKRALKEAGVPSERISEIVVETIEYKVSGVEANKAAKASDEVGAIIEKFTTVEEKTPSVAVNRVGGGRGSMPAQPRRGLTAKEAPAPADDLLTPAVDPLAGELPWD